MKALCIGYFDRGNFGDQLFAWLYAKMFPDMVICSIEDLDPGVLNEFDVTLLAGGDMLNAYFLARLVNVLESVNYGGAVYAFSVGIPEHEKPKNLRVVTSMFSGIVLRSLRDYSWCASSMKTMYHPDVSIFTLDYVDKKNIDPWALIPRTIPRTPGTIPRTIPELDPKRVILTVAQPYAPHLDSLCALLRDLTENHGCVVYMIPFNTFASSERECDFFLQDKIARALASDRIVNVQRALSVEEMVRVYQVMDFGMHMRYHAHMLSVVTGLPFVTLGKTPKTVQLMADLGLGDQKHSWFDQSTGVFALGALPDPAEQRTAFAHYLDDFKAEQYKATVESWIREPRSHLQVRCPLYSTLGAVVEYVQEKSSLTVAHDDWIRKAIFHPGAIQKLLLKAGLDAPREFLASLVCLKLIQTPYPKYHFGLASKILDPTFMAADELQWVYDDHMVGSGAEVGREEIPTWTVKIARLDKAEFTGVHRSGWGYVLNALAPHHRADAPLLLDTYLDRTFHWCHDILEYTKDIPYTQPWIGFVHHTFDTKYSPHNAHEMLAKKTFQDSLPWCRGLVVMSREMQAQLAEKVDVPVFFVYHPTEFLGVPQFDMKLFLEAPQVVQVGAWLRNSYSVYRLQPAKNNIKKCALRGKNMENNFCPDDLVLVAKSAQEQVTCSLRGQQQSASNKFVAGMLEALHASVRSVHEISALSNRDYDKLLQRSVVFLDLVDAAAVNTVLECIVRNTPLLVNKLPAVVEYMGEDYPLYYSSLAEANVLVSDFERIMAAHAYLKRIDKSRFRVERFLDGIGNVVDGGI
jgi:hypothetical protein